MISRILFPLLFVVVSAFHGSAAHAQARSAPVGVGESAPDFTLTDQGGRKHTLSAQRGKRPVVLIFYRGHW
jgi:cytochrome oxidase Cu insertion factor (SCO1/SenC/PrrC family)